MTITGAPANARRSNNNSASVRAAVLGLHEGESGGLAWFHWLTRQHPAVGNQNLAL
jgi:hypothetical protein